MGKALVKGGIVGGIILFIWMMISWMVIPWHCFNMNSFTNEEAVASVLMENTPDDGIYVLPNVCSEKGGMENHMTKMKKGPVVFVAIQKYGFDIDSLAPYIIAFIIQLIGAFIVSFLLYQTRGDLHYWSKVLFLTLTGLAIGVLGSLPNWNWWGFSFGYVFIELLDHVIGWFLAGLAIAPLVKRS